MLPDTFRFSQASLQDYVDCPRRFQLRYIEMLAWPAPQTEPLLEFEDHLERGARFHRLVERHQLGMNPVVLEASLAGDESLLAWWRAYLGFSRVHNLEGQRYPELLLTTELGKQRLVAKFDLLVVVPGERVVVFDWKTTLRVLSRQWYESRLQTSVYLLVALRAAGVLFGAELVPEQVSMVYWSAVGTSTQVEFVYSYERYLLDVDFLSRLIQEIWGRDLAEVWPLAVDEVRCRFCRYRSLCDRGNQAGVLESDSNIFDNITCEDLDLGFVGVDEFGF